jgi:hypothetical protein
MAEVQDQSQSTSTSATSAAPPPGMAVPSALPSLNPEDSPYKPLSLPEVAPPTQHPLPEQQPIQNLGATSKAGAVAFMADQVLRGATQGYDQARLQHAQQFNKKMTALSALQQQLGQQYKEAYEEVGSSQPGMTPEQILADPKVKQLHNQLLAVHQTTLDAIQKYLPPLQTDKKTGKTKEKRNLLERMFGQEPDESLRAYAEAAGKLGPTAFYQVKSPQQLQADYQAMQGKAAVQTAATATAQATTSKSQIQQSLYDATRELNALSPTATMFTSNPKDLFAPSNLPIWTRPDVQNADGTHSSEYSTSFTDERTNSPYRGKEVLVPSIVDGKFLTPDGKKPPEGSDAEKAMFDKARQHYYQTGQQLGVFNNPAAADAYADALHNRGTLDDRRAALQKQIDADTAALNPTRRLTEGEQKRQDYQNLLATGQVPKDQQGNPMSYEAWVASQSAAGRVAGTPPKTPSMKTGIADGHNVYAYYDPAKKTWINSNTNQPAPDFRPQPTFAETGLYEPILTYDPSTGKLVSGTFNRRTGETRAQTIGTTGPLSPSVASALQKNIEPAVEADTRYKIMLDNSVEALRGDQQAMVSLLMNHIGMTLGAQKGTRVAKSVIDEAQASAPWVQRVYAAWGHWDQDGSYVYDGYKTGTKLTGQQISQMLALAKTRRVRQWQQAQEAGTAYGIEFTPPPLDTSLSTARVAPPASAGGVDVTAPDNSVHHFPTQEAADKFKKAAGIK